MLNQTLWKQVKKWAAWELFVKKLSKQCKAIHATALSEMASVKATGLQTQVAVIPAGIDTYELSNLPSLEVFDRCFPGLSKLRILLFLSRLHPVKGLVNLAHAWGKLAPQFPDWHLLIAGPDYNNHRYKVETVLKSYDIEGHYTFAGHLTGEARLAAYGAADLFVLPTYSENFGIVIAEALMAKTPVITTIETPWEEIVSHGCGWIIRPRESDLIETLGRALTLEKSALDEMGERGRSFVKKKYSWDSVALKMKRLYRWILYGGEKPGFVYSLKGAQRIRLPFKKPQRLI